MDWNFGWKSLTPDLTWITAIYPEFPTLPLLLLYLNKNRWRADNRSVRDVMPTRGNHGNKKAWSIDSWALILPIVIAQCCLWDFRWWRIPSVCFFTPSVSVEPQPPDPSPLPSSPSRQTTDTNITHAVAGNKRWWEERAICVTMATRVTNDE